MTVMNSDHYEGHLQASALYNYYELESVKPVSVSVVGGVLFSGSHTDPLHLPIAIMWPKYV